jgi:hypothetical protein
MTHQLGVRGQLGQQGVLLADPRLGGACDIWLLHDKLAGLCMQL